MAKRKKKEKKFMLSAVVYGVFDCDKKELLKVSLDEDEIEMDLAIQYSENKYSRCEFTIELAI